MNWTAWNSVVANALTKSPSAMPSSALASASSTSTTAGRVVSSPSGPSEMAATQIVCTSATAPIGASL